MSDKKTTAPAQATTQTKNIVLKKGVSKTASAPAVTIPTVTASPVPAVETTATDATVTPPVAAPEVVEKKKSVSKTNTKSIDNILSKIIAHFNLNKKLVVELIRADLPISSQFVRKQKKNPDLPKKPLTPYLYFTMDKRQSVKDGNKDIKFAETTKRLGEMWKEITPEDRKIYDEKGREDKARYEKQMAEFNEKAKAEAELRAKNEPAVPAAAIESKVRATKTRNPIDHSADPDYIKDDKGLWHKKTSTKGKKLLAPVVTAAPAEITA